MSDYTTLTLERPVEGVAVATLNRPDRLNAITFRMFEEWVAVCDEIAADDTVRALVLTGAGRAFCAGLDLADASTLPGMTVPEMMRGQESWADATAAFHRLPKPVIAAVNGAAAGAGFSLALAADIRIAAPEARFNAAFVRIGLSGGDCGTSWFLPRVVGLGRAADILLTGRFVGAEEAATIGLVNRVVPADELLAEALATAQQIASNTPLGVFLTKRVLHLNVDAPSLTAALEVENRNQVLTTRTEDMAEALTAFQEKRPARFSGR
jgi:enoyl-CoA hydratase/carnithine racemase